MTVLSAEVRERLWRTPIAELRRCDDQRPAKAWSRRGNQRQWSDPTTPARLLLPWEDWTWPIWLADLGEFPTRRVNVWRSPAHWHMGGYYVTGAPSKTMPAIVPWGPDYRTATAEDAGSIVNLPDGTGYELLNMRPASDWDRFLIGLAMDLAEKERTGNPFAWVDQARKPRPGDFIADSVFHRTPATAFRRRSRGSGDTPKITGIVEARHVLAGRIEFAAAVAGFTQFGPGARVGQLATIVEHPAGAPNGYPASMPSGWQPDLVCPAGTRLALRITDAEIGQWITRRGYTGALARTARCFAVALRDFGFVHGAETGVVWPMIETSGIRNPAEAALWRQAGLSTKAVAVSLLDGLPFDQVETFEFAA